MSYSFRKFKNSILEISIPWTNSNFCPTSIDGIVESETDIAFAKKLEYKTVAGLFGKSAIINAAFPGESRIFLPHQVIFGDNLIATADELENFTKETKLEVGNAWHIQIRDAYTYLKLFEKYQDYISLIN